MEIIEGEELTEEEKATGVVEISADALQSAEPNELSEEELEEIAGGANQIQVYSKPKKYCPWCNMLKA
ncbi:MAG: hypothetical protein IJJ13_03290 [Lachnospiraceae bacterium]|nr:hypothetical protein [Lachnospiraceae bacterium]